ncbi:VCBS repeat-containing protein [Nostoc sp. CHAB 5715]|uniref:FG-GAP repeat domain-containing protein n=1 Tax=Nostoc sp. CHAB 5715 TaxID=2780400 RepID=UPI001E5C512F|nr:VCBS repeat-containing protein [Nostoc sp. CHAB 5715]MCC5620944.1 VCBS repeat-containing protein [Nostoc sp. CHAB 5715]
MSTFTFLPAQDRSETGWNGFDALTGDVNGDGLTDLIWNETGNINRTYVGLSNGNGTFTFLPAQDRSETGWNGFDALTGDVNGDGLTDLIWNETGNINRTYVGLSNGNGTFTFLPAQDRSETGWNGFDALTGDVNGDGLTDLIWNETGNINRTYVGLSNGNGTFTFLGAQDRSETGWNGFDALTGDVNGDGLTDLIWNETGNINRTYVGLAI